MDLGKTKFEVLIVFWVLFNYPAKSERNNLLERDSSSFLFKIRNKRLIAA